MPNSELNTLRNLNNQIYFIGTLHVAIDSATLVHKTIETLKLDCVMIELDEIRYQDLLHPEMKHKEEETLKDKNNEETPDLLFKVLNKIQQEIGESLGLIPGMEMISAINAVRQNKIPIKLIDQPIMVTFQRLNELKDSAQKEQTDFINLLKENPIDTKDSEIYELIEQFKKPGFIKKLIVEFKETYPNLYKILIDERNEYMVKQILEYLKNNPSHRVLIIVGAGHLEELMRLTEENLSKTKNI
ncbi:TraB domain-containing protein [Promethearchaeum syntrophicum]|uniref:TraB domain-containing protein n=1 Tax=Promethearchaeum syntrophicum TaxID=2594042 RepID=A0A5B9D778_9ARCH|nr:TraB domain-containing protein [Candidatus Prometheoarchaeum syntrophicum]